jgi:hypothetical protein
VSVEIDELDATLAVGELPHLIGALEALASEGCHGSPARRSRD